jgi:catechol 2,3-dioxygenase-like lactoylglutathione lyase family enzyme
MHIGHIELFVSDPLASRDFYVTKLGFEVVAEQGPEGQAPRFVWLKLGESGPEILLRPGKPLSQPSYQQAQAGIVLYTSDEPATMKELSARGLVINGEDTGCPCFSDPDGHWWQIVNPEQA